MGPADGVCALCARRGHPEGRAAGGTTLSSYDLDKMQKNQDGSVTLYVGPGAPEGLESNWIPTRGKRPLPTFRFYGPTDELINKTFKMPDFELVRASAS